MAFSCFGVQAVTPQLMAAFVSAPTPASQHTILAVLRGLECAAPAAALYPALVQMRQAQPGEPVPRIVTVHGSVGTSLESRSWVIISCIFLVIITKPRVYVEYKS